MPNNLTIRADGGSVISRITVLDLAFVSAIDIWNDSDGDRRPDGYSHRVKYPNSGENTYVQIGSPTSLDGKIVQWSWMISRPDTSVQTWTVEIDVQQDGLQVAGFPAQYSGHFEGGPLHGLWQIWLPVRHA